ncbi:hypothetical protein [Pseudovibrio sp. Tun.PSC04-5.I4]|uniref:hypothetical protein n=1 Tax=Pseudovibrio sp. Tun.PSC04-5.I4 TaxID=1798213 RepID=UPI00135634A7|nr:hypothetical protein [Pseudovibrio sp. Tun.PSC04-5.I4]
MNISQNLLTDIKIFMNEAGAIPMPEEGSFEWIFEMVRDAATGAAPKALAACNDHSDC